MSVAGWVEIHVRSDVDSAAGQWAWGRGLRIECSNRSSWIEIERRGDRQYSWFEIGCGIDIGHGNFFARNGDIQFLNAESFVHELDRFRLDRSLTPQLDGSFGIFLILWRPGAKDDVMLSFAIGDAYCGGPVATEFNLTGSFALPPDTLDTLAAAFRCTLVDALPG